MVDEVSCELNIVDASLDECLNLIEDGDMERPQEVVKVIRITFIRLFGRG